MGEGVCQAIARGENGDISWLTRVAKKQNQRTGSATRWSLHCDGASAPLATLGESCLEAQWWMWEASDW